MLSWSEPMLKNKPLILCLLFIAVFSLSTVFGVPMGEAHPKQNFDPTPAISQPNFTDFIEQDLPFFATILKYYPFIIEDGFATFNQNYQNKVRVLLEKQLQLVLSVVSISAIYFLYLYPKLISRQQSKPFFT